MKKCLKIAVSLIFCLTVLAAGCRIAPSAAGFYKKADMLCIGSHIEDDVGLSLYSNVQGACAGGGYAYFAFMQGSVCNVAKFSTRTWKYVEKKKIANMGHSNDMTYNGDKDYIVVANNAPYYDVVTLVDPKSLEPIKDVKLDVDIYSIAYNSSRKCYVAGLSGSYNFALLDSDFKVIKKIKGVNTGYTRQGGDCDDDYIYFVQSGGNNLLVVYDYSGKHIADIPMTDTDEAENIFHVGSAFYSTLYYYGNTLYRIGFSPDSEISFKVNYDAGGGEGEMKSTTVSYGEKTKLRECSFTREGYRFAGWRVQRTSDDRYIGYKNGEDDYGWLDEEDVFNYLLYDDEETVSKTVKFGNVLMTASWYSELYDISFDPGDGEGESFTEIAAHDSDFGLPDAGYYKEGYIFTGYMAERDADDRVYGYRKGRDEPEWLYPEDADRPYLFSPGENVKALTPEGTVAMSAQYRSAYTFDDSGSTLLEYVGVDEKVRIPDGDGELKTIAGGAFSGNDIIRELYVPGSVRSLQKEAVADCPRFRSITFEGRLPSEIDGESIVSDKATVVYEMSDGQAHCLGFFSGKDSLVILRYCEGVLCGEQDVGNSGVTLNA